MEKTPQLSAYLKVIHFSPKIVEIKVKKSAPPYDTEHEGR